MLIGGDGLDNLYGGAGADVFVLQNRLDSRDTIRDFAPVDDQLRISRSVFGNFDAGGARAPADWFVSSTSGVATDSNDRFIYNPNTGILYFDADGLGGAARVQIAAFAGNPAITAADFTIVA